MSPLKADASLAEKLAALKPAPNATTVEQLRLSGQRHALKRDAVMAGPPLAGTSWAVGPYTVRIVSGPTIGLTPALVAVAQVVVTITLAGVNVTPVNLNPIQTFDTTPTTDPRTAFMNNVRTATTGAIVQMTAGPAPTPAPVPIPVPLPTGFMSAPRSDAIYIGGAQPTYDVLIENKSFRDLNVRAIILENVRRAMIRNCDFENVQTAIYALNCEEVEVQEDRYRNITGPNGNFVQFDKVNGGGGVRRCKGIGGNTEDIVSFYMSHGTPAKLLVAEDNHFEQTGWGSGTGSGIMLGDANGSYQIARRNKLLNPGQVGIGLSGGDHIYADDNVIYGEQRAGSNVGMYVQPQGGAPCSNQGLARNKVWWINEAGIHNEIYVLGMQWGDPDPMQPKQWGPCGPLAGWTTNDWRPSLDLATLRVTL